MLVWEPPVVNHPSVRPRAAKVGLHSSEELPQRACHTATKAIKMWGDRRAGKTLRNTVW